MRAFIIDEQTMFVDSIRVALDDVGISVIHEAVRPSDVVQSVRRWQPDVNVVDVGQHDGSGLQTGQRILEEYPDAKIIAMTGHPDRAMSEHALRMGFTGYLSKEASVSAFVHALRSDGEGQVVRPRQLSAARSRQGALPSTWGLTSRERQVLAILVRGSTTQTGAAELGVSTNTFRTHVENILTKMQVHSRLEAVTLAWQDRIA